jgi:hypothetical protein
MDSLLYWLFQGKQHLPMKFIFQKPVFNVTFDGINFQDKFAEWKENRSFYGRKSRDLLIPLNYVVREEPATGFYYLLNGYYVDPKQYADCACQAVTLLASWYVERHVSIEDRSDMLADLPHIVDADFAESLLAGTYHPFEIFMKKFPSGSIHDMPLYRINHPFKVRINK